MIEKLSDVILAALEAQSAEDGLVMVKADDLTAVELEGAFDLRDLALTILANLPTGAAEANAPNAFVRIDPETGQLQTFLIAGAKL